MRMSENNINIENRISARNGRVRLILIIAAVALLVAVGVCVILFFVLRGDKPLPREREVFYSDDFEYAYKTDDTLTILSYTGTDSTVHVPTTINGLAVVEIAKEAFLGNTDTVSGSISYSTRFTLLL